MRRDRLPELAGEITDELQSLASLVEALQETRNIYGYELDGGRVAALAKRAGAVFASFRSEVEQFCGFLRDMAG